MVYTLAWQLLAIGPYVLLAFGASYLRNRHSRLPAALVAFGFAATALSQLAAAYVSAALSAAVNSGDGMETLARFRHWTWLTHGLGLLGLWSAAAGLLTYALRQPPTDAR